MDNKLIEKCKNYVNREFIESDIEMLSYHNWKHTMNVYNSATLIGENTEGVSEDDIRILKIAALFHDIGYIESPKAHEERSAAIAASFLEEHDVSKEEIKKITDLILITDISKEPKTTLEKIIRDADLSHLGRADYVTTTYLFLSNEVSEMNKADMSDSDWALSCVEFLNSHKYYTEYGKKLYQSAKLKNLEKVRELAKNDISSQLAEEVKRSKTAYQAKKARRMEQKRIKEENSKKMNSSLDIKDQNPNNPTQKIEKIDEMLDTLETKKEKKKEKKKKKKKKKNRKVTPSKQDQSNPLKGVETMLKVTLRNHVDLSAIADQKANTLISVNAIIISIVLSALFPKLDANPFLFYPSVTILISCFVTMILSILSTIPNVTNGEITKEEIENEEGNIMFFGNFHKMKLSDFEWSMQQVWEKKDYLYNTMSRDLFFLGVVLNKKYNLLRYAYYIFVIGFLASIIVFTINIFPYIGSTTSIEFQGATEGLNEGMKVLP